MWIMPGISTAPTARKPPPPCRMWISWWRVCGAAGPAALPIDLIVVSDHGMEQEQGRLDRPRPVRRSGELHHRGLAALPQSEAAAEKAYQELKIKSDAFTVYRRKRVPAALHYDSNAREGDPVIVANGPYAIRAQAGDEGRHPKREVHGYDPRVMKSMRALFLAVGPDIRPGSTLEPFENVNVYPLVANILGLDAPQVDGRLNVLSKILKNPTRPTTTVPKRPTVIASCPVFSDLLQKLS